MCSHIQYHQHRKKTQHNRVNVFDLRTIFFPNIIYCGKKCMQVPKKINRHVCSKFASIVETWYEIEKFSLFFYKFDFFFIHLKLKLFIARFLYIHKLQTKDSWGDLKLILEKKKNSMVEHFYCFLFDIHFKRLKNIKV